MLSINSCGLANISLIVGLLLMAVAMPVATKMVQETQDKRISAAYSSIEVDCQPRCSNNYGCMSTGKYIGIGDCDHPKVKPSYSYDAKCSEVGSAGIAAGGNNNACIVVSEVNCPSKCSSNYGCKKTSDYIGLGDCTKPKAGTVAYKTVLESECPKVGDVGLAAGGNNDACSSKWSVVANSCNLSTGEFNCELKEGGTFDTEEICKKSIGCGDEPYYCMPDIAPTVVCIDTRLPENGLCEIGKIYEWETEQFGIANNINCNQWTGVIDPNRDIKIKTAKNIAGDLALKLCLNSDTSVISDLINALNKTGQSHNTNVDSYMSWVGNRDQCDSFFEVGWITNTSGYLTKKQEAAGICSQYSALLKGSDPYGNKSIILDLMSKYVTLVGGGFTNNFDDLVEYAKTHSDMCSDPGSVVGGVGVSNVDVGTTNNIILNNCKKCKANQNAGLSNFMCKSTLSILDLGTWVTEMSNFNEINKIDWKSDMNCDGVVNSLDLPMIKSKFTL